MCITQVYGYIVSSYYQIKLADTTCVYFNRSRRIDVCKNVDDICIVITQ